LPAGEIDDPRLHGEVFFAGGEQFLHGGGRFVDQGKEDIVGQERFGHYSILQETDNRQHTHSWIDIPSAKVAMRFLDLTLPRLAENLALDEALLLGAEESEGDELLRFWTWPQFAVVLGAGGVIADDVNEAHSVPIARRSSGGGTVLLGPGCLLFSLVLDIDRAPELTQINPSYRWILDRVARALAGLQRGIQFAGTSDLAVAGRKFSGNSQQRKRRFLLHHGTILHGFDLDAVGRYLKLPPRRPDYRGDRPHREFLMNLASEPDEIRRCLREEWRAEEKEPDWPEKLVRQLVVEKYSTVEFIRRR
jgi:lipoate---protein ligase